MIEVKELTKRYGSKLALDRMSFEAKAGRVTGFLGPNGAGKSTTMRTILGLDIPNSGVALINGQPYTSMQRPMHEVGALLDGGAAHGGRSAFNHLYGLARSNRIGRARVGEVLEQVGLANVAHKRVGTFSLGMRQRLGIAVALLGDPGVLLFDEPVNGLDPEGIRWIRELMRSLAADGRTVLVSSHLMSEMALTADHVLVIGRGRLIRETSMEDLAEQFHQDVLVRSPRSTELSSLLVAAGATVVAVSADTIEVAGVEAAAIGDVASVNGIPIHELTPRSASLEDIYLNLTMDSTEYRAEAGRTEA